jgi:3-hydroxybutyryl-CoA dehydrogenase
MTIDKIRVIGAGAMGRGIAQIAVAAGYSVELTDASDDAVTAALEFVTRMLRRSAEKGQRSPQDAEAAIARLTRGTATAPADDIDLVIEAVVEQLEVKRAIFTQVERAVPNAILASNTSSLSITAIAAGLQDPSRLLGLHFFNPVPLMRLVEVIPGVRTSPELITAATRFVATLGHTAVHAKDTPGFLVNHLGRALPTESLALLSEGVASVADIDRIARDTVGLRMGPFELMDLTGLDVSHPVMEIVWSGFYADPRLRPSVESAGRFAGGLLGRKTGEGFYRYRDDAPDVPPEPGIAADADAIAVFVHDNDAFAELLRASGVHVIDAPSETSVAVVFPVGEPAYRAALAAGVDPARTVGIDPVSIDGKRLTVVAPAALDPAVGRSALRALAATGLAVTVTTDATAPVAQRLIASIVNLSCALAEQGIGKPGDIDLGARLGLGYPRGPLELGDAVGPTLIVRILDGLHAYTGDPRYRTSTWLRSRAEQGMSLRDNGIRPHDLIN